MILVSHLRPDAFLYSKKNVCVLGDKVLFVCWGFFTYLCLHSLACDQETKFKIWMSFNNSHLCMYRNFQGIYHERMLKWIHVASPQLFTDCVAVVCSLYVDSLEKLERFCCLVCFLKIKQLTLILFWLCVCFNTNVIQITTESICFFLDSNLLFSSDLVLWTLLLRSVNDLLSSELDFLPGLGVFRLLCCFIDIWP